MTGCRPNEAAYLVRARRVVPNTYPDFKPLKWAAELPAAFSKTKKNYQWGLPAKMEPMVTLLHDLHRY